MGERLQEVAALGRLSAAELTALWQQHQATLFPPPPATDPTDWAAVLEAIGGLEAGSGLSLLSP